MTTPSKAEGEEMTNDIEPELCKFCHFTQESHIDGRYCSTYRISEFKAPAQGKDWTASDDAHMDAQGGMGSYDPPIDRLKEIPVPQNEQTFEQWKKNTHPHVDRVTTVFMREAWNAALSQPVPQGEQSLPPQLVSDAEVQLAIDEHRTFWSEEIAIELQQLREYVRKGQQNG